MKLAFSPKLGAGVLAFLGATYMIGALASGHSARSETPPDLTAGAAEAGLDVWKTAAAVIEAQGRAAIVDVRPKEEFDLYHLPGAVNSPGEDASEIQKLAQERPEVIVVAAKNEEAQKLVGAVKQASPQAPVHYLVDGARAWYLTFDLPVALFNEAAPPSGYQQALATIKESMVRPDGAAKEKAIESLQTLVKLGYEPALLKQAGKPKAGGAKKKKISGGCG